MRKWFRAGKIDQGHVTFGFADSQSEGPFSIRLYGKLFKALKLYSDKIMILFFYTTPLICPECVGLKLSRYITIKLD